MTKEEAEACQILVRGQNEHGIADLAEMASIFGLREIRAADRGAWELRQEVCEILQKTDRDLADQIWNYFDATRGWGPRTGMPQTEKAG